MRRLSKLWKGELRLAEAFWLWGIVGTLALSIAGQLLLSRLLVSGWIASVLLFTYFLTAVGISYVVFVSVGIWKSAGRYIGLKLWPWASRAVVVAFAALNIYSVAVIALHAPEDTNDPGKTSNNISDFLEPSAEYPFVGFWKNSCEDDFGLAIDGQHDGLYSASFCGPAGCFKPGTYRPNTRLIDDPDYRIIDQNTLEVRGLGGFSRYVRCDALPSGSTAESQSNLSVTRDAASGAP